MFVVTTQILENYGAHSEDGKFASGNAYWKMKGGNDYIVRHVERAQDAMAFVMAKFSENNIYFKEFPIEVKTWREWQEALPEDEDYRAFIVEQAITCTPVEEAA